jgi:hypothetical protein
MQDADGNTIYVTANEAARLDSQTNEANTQNENYQQATTPYDVQFYTHDYKPIQKTNAFGDVISSTDETGRLSSEEADAMSKEAKITKKPDPVIAVLPDGTSMPYTDYIKSASKTVIKGEATAPSYFRAANANAGPVGQGGYGSGARNPNALRSEAEIALRQRPDKELEIRARFKQLTGEDL